MSVAFGWFLVTQFGEAATREFVTKVPNNGLTEKIGGRWVDLWVDKGELRVDPADVAPQLDELERRLAGGGSLAVPLASRLELVQTICIEPAKESRWQKALKFRGYRVCDIESALTAVEEEIDALGKKEDATLEGLHACLHRAQQLHVAVVFGPA